MIGGGLAGISAALALAEAGHGVVLLERLRTLGGRARSVVIPALGFRTDFGQHLMLGAYARTLALVDTLGTRHLVREVREAVPLVTDRGTAQLNRGAWLPAPLRAADAIRCLAHLSLAERLGLLRVAAAARRELRARPAGLDSQTVARWLAALGQSRWAVEGLWAPVAEAALNLSPEESSALLFAAVLSKGFFSSGRDALPLLPRTTLDDLIVAPAVGRLRAAGAQVRPGAAVRGIETSGTRVVAAACPGGERVTGDVFVCAVSNVDLPVALGGAAGLERLLASARALGSAPAVTVYLRYAEPWLGCSYAGLPGGPAQWIFEHRLPDGSAVVAAVASGADGLMAAGRDALVGAVRRDVERRLPRAARAGFLGGAALKAGAATFRGRPGQMRLRPGPVSGTLRNLFLAGDWTDTGLPATIEGAIGSGAAAAAAAAAGA